MDDFYIISSDKLLLREILKRIEEYIKPLGLRLNGKTQIFPLKNGIDFLGFHTYLTQHRQGGQKGEGQEHRQHEAQDPQVPRSGGLRQDDPRQRRAILRKLDGPHLARQHLPPAAEHGRLFLQLFPGAQTITERRHNSWPKN